MLYYNLSCYIPIADGPREKNPDAVLSATMSPRPRPLPRPLPRPRARSPRPLNDPRPCSAF